MLPCFSPGRPGPIALGNGMHLCVPTYGRALARTILSSPSIPRRTSRRWRLLLVTLALLLSGLAGLTIPRLLR